MYTMHSMYCMYCMYCMYSVPCMYNTYNMYCSVSALCLPLLLGCNSVNGSINGFSVFFTVSLLLLRQRLVPTVAIGLQLREGLDQRGIPWDTMYVWDSLGKQWMFGNPWGNNGCLGILGKQWMFGNPWGINGCLGRAGETINNVL